MTENTYNKETGSNGEKVLICHECADAVIEVGTTDGFVLTCGCRGKKASAEHSQPAEADEAWMWGEVA